MIKKFLMLIAIAASLGFLSRHIGLNPQQSFSIAIFSASILGTLFFWQFRLSFAFLGISLLLMTKTIDIQHMIEFSSLEVILFLVGMMILVGLLKENGFFTFITHKLLNIPYLTAGKFIIILSLVSAVLSATTSEVISIIFMVAAVFEICDHLKLDPVPYVIISVMATNVGSAATVLGNPIGILIATKAGLTFEDFIIKALPLSVVCLVATIGICMVWYRKQIAEMDTALENASKKHLSVIDQTPIKFTGELRTSVIIFCATLVFISLHHRLELLWNLGHNTILLIMPLISSGIVMIWKRDKAREYVEKDVEWWTLLFFMFLFAQAGTLQYTGATDELAKKLTYFCGHNLNLLTGIVLWISTIGSAILDNVVLVAAFIPMVLSCAPITETVQPLWWALLFGGCLGGNITLVGSTANIIALGMLEKEKNIHITFMRWVGIGLSVGITTTVIVWIALSILPFYR